MKIMILCKRRPQQKDLWLRPNGRFFHLAKYLATSGHQVDFILLNYKNEKQFTEQRNGITWHSVNIFPNPFTWITVTSALAKTNKPDWVIGFSDTYFGILAVLLARQFQAKSLVDAYDNYESYIAWCKPLHWLWRYALKSADVITAPGESLLDKMQVGRDNHRQKYILPMVADEQFTAELKAEARNALGLPHDKKLVGYCGAIHNSRGLEILFEAMEIFSRKHSDCILVMTGKVQPNLILPKNCIHLGYLDDQKMPSVLSAMDVVVAVNKASTFGNYSYPVKIYEALACGVPVLASCTLSVAEVLGANNSALFAVDNVRALVEKLEQFFSGNLQYTLPVREHWWQTGQKLEQLLLDNNHK